MSIFSKLLDAIRIKRELERKRVRAEVLKEFNITELDVKEGQYILREEVFTLGDMREVVDIKLYKLVCHKESEIKANIEFHERTVLSEKDN